MTNSKNILFCLHWQRRRRLMRELRLQEQANPATGIAQFNRDRRVQNLEHACQRSSRCGTCEACLYDKVTLGEDV